MCIYIYVYVFVYVCVYVYIYIHVICYAPLAKKNNLLGVLIPRDLTQDNIHPIKAESEPSVYTYIYIYTHTHIYAYINMSKEPFHAYVFQPIKAD